MTGYQYDIPQKPDPWEHPTSEKIEVSVTSASNQEQTMTNEVNFEDPTMRQNFFTWLSNKVTTASDLAKRVAELETVVHNLEVQLRDARENAEAERAARNETERQLHDIQSKLEHEQRAVHDLVMERDIVVEERNNAQRERDEWKINSDSLMRERDVAWQDLGRARDHSHVLEERCMLLTQRIAALKDAFGALNNL